MMKLFVRIVVMLGMALGTALSFPSDNIKQTSAKNLSASMDLNDTIIEYEAYDETFVDMARPSFDQRPAGLLATALSVRPNGVIDPKPLKQVKRNGITNNYFI